MVSILSLILFLSTFFYIFVVCAAPDSSAAVGTSKLRLVKQQQLQQCDDRLEQLVGDIFRGNEMVPDIIDRPPPHHLDLTFRYKYGTSGRRHIQGQ